MKLTLASVLLVVAIACFSVGSADAQWGNRWGGGGGWGNRWGSGWGSGWGNQYYNSYYNPYSSYYNAYSTFWKRATEPAKTAECTYLSNTTMFVCETPSKRVECASEEVMEKLSVPIPVFAIGQTPVGDIKDVENVRYSLFYQSEKDMWNRTYTDATTSKVFNFALFFTPKVDEHGLRIKDISCWRNMTTFFTGLTRFEPIKVGTEEIQVIGGVISL